MRNAKFCEVVFVGCNVSRAKVEGCRLHGVQFEECKLEGIEFFKLDKMFFSVSFKSCLLRYCNFSDLNMKNTTFCKSKLMENHFTHTCLTGADFTDVDLAGTHFHHCDLSRANFATATQYGIDPQTNTIKEARFSLPEAMSLLKGFEIVLE